MNASLKMAMAQLVVSSSMEENLMLAGKSIDHTKKLGADLVLFPEMFMGLPSGPGPLTDLAEPIDGPFVSAMSGLARQAGLNVITGFWETIPGQSRVWNSAVAISSTGDIVATYRKLHLFDALNVTESDRMAKGDGLPPVFRINGVNVGIAICYDLRFPELFRYLAEEEAELVVVIGAWYAGPLKEEHWLTLLRARAIENTFYVAGVNQTGGPFCGRSALFDPFGVPCVGAGDSPELLVAEMFSERVASVRTRLPSLAHRRLDMFPKQIHSDITVNRVRSHNYLKLYTTISQVKVCS